MIDCVVTDLNDTDQHSAVSVLPLSPSNPNLELESFLPPPYSHQNEHLLLSAHLFRLLLFRWRSSRRSGIFPFILNHSVHSTTGPYFGAFIWLVSSFSFSNVGFNLFASLRIWLLAYPLCPLEITLFPNSLRLLLQISLSSRWHCDFKIFPYFRTSYSSHEVIFFCQRFVDVCRVWVNEVYPSKSFFRVFQCRCDLYLHRLCIQTNKQTNKQVKIK